MTTNMRKNMVSRLVQDKYDTDKMLHNAAYF